ncbi:unnamed protein product [Fraxinus pennsylvanica]|uniref:Uncharacterized protein n=1 Tax=Fraxinus pennsylvanica TaxID=56036 RepID=A0AAD2A0D4_9LAMI|nr:unnamed protein product [Fraxinus pennsylvanica]
MRRPHFRREKSEKSSERRSTVKMASKPYPNSVFVFRGGLFEEGEFDGDTLQDVVRVPHNSSGPMWRASQGLKAMDGEDPPKILDFNPRIKVDSSGQLVIEKKTCYRMQ